jgi:hypothetical protein
MRLKSIADYSQPSSLDFFAVCYAMWQRSSRAWGLSCISQLFVGAMILCGPGSEAIAVPYHDNKECEKFWEKN